MHWNFGGNFQPVATVCKYSEWTKCLTTFIKYVWFELVTDVADCLANESILWSILAMLLIFLTIAYLAYWRLQWKKEVKRNQEKFKVVNHKIQDIELKVDIITYKTQYGIWPSQSQEKHTLTNPKNYRFGLSKFTLENSWIKNLLARAEQNQYALEKYSSIRKNPLENYPSVEQPNFPPSDFNNKLLSDAEKDDAFGYYTACQNDIGENAGELLQSVNNGRFNSLIIPPESNLSDRSKNPILYVKKNIRTHHDNLSRRKSITLDNFAFEQKKFARNKDLKVIASTSNMTFLPKALLPELQNKMSNALSKTSSSLSERHGTLYEVQKKLKSLYATIHNCNTKNPLVPMLELDSDSNRAHSSKTLLSEVEKCTEDAFLLEDSKKSLKDVNKQQAFGEYLILTTTGTQEPKPLNEIGSKNNDSYNDSEKTADGSQGCNIQDDKKAGHVVANKDKTGHHLLELHSIEVTDTENISDDELTPKAFRVKPLEDSTSALLQEALMFKKQILSNVESQGNGIDIKEEHASNCSETTSESSLKQCNTKFDSKILDMITEESSVSSCTEKKAELHSYKIVEKNKIAQDKTSVLGEKTKRPTSKNTVSNLEQLPDEKTKKQKEVNCPSKVSNKCSNAESPNNRKFPSSFSSIILCNDQDVTNHCKQMEDSVTALATKSSQDLISLTESSSDVSVNRLINRLIEHERKSKNQLLAEPENITNDSSKNFASPDDINLADSAIESKNSSVNYNDIVLQESKIEPINDEERARPGMSNEDDSRLECLREIKNVAKKLIDSVLDTKNNENHCRSKLKSYSDIISQQSPIPKIKRQNSEIKDVTETSNIDPSTDKCGIGSDSHTNEKCITWKTSRTEPYDALPTSKESEVTSDFTSSNDVQKTLTKHNFDCNTSKPCRVKSNLDFTSGDKRFKLSHRRSRSYVNPRGITDEFECQFEKEHFLEPKPNKLSAIKVFNPKITDNFTNDVGMKRNKSSDSLCSKSSSNSIQRLISLKDGHMKLTKNCSETLEVNPNKKNDIENESSLELIPVSSCSSLKSSIPVMKNELALQKSEDAYLQNPVESSSNLSLEKKTQDSICQAETDNDDISSLPTDKEKSSSDMFTSFSDVENLKNFEQNAILYYNLVSGDQLISNYINQTNLSDAIEELIVPDKVVCNRVNNAASTVSETIDRPITCVLSDELSELNPLNSFLFQNAIPNISPYKIERKETEVLVKPSTLDISTSMTNLPCVYHFEEDNKTNDVKIFEISDELTKEECIRYLQMFDQDSNQDQSTNTQDFCNKLLEDI